MGIVKASDEAIRAAAEHLRAGRLVAFPTETVYGLGADATNGAAVAAIFAAKGRPRFNPLIVHVADVGQAGEHARADRAGAAAHRRVLAGTADAGAGQARRARRCRISSPAGLDDHRRARAGSSGGARAARGDRPAARCPVRQPLRAHQPDAGRARAGRTSATTAAMILDGGADRAWIGVDHRRCARRRAGAAAPGRRHGGDHRSRARAACRAR